MHFPLDPDDDCRFVGRGLRAHRLAQDVTQTELAARSGVSQATVKRIETTGKGSLRDVVSMARCLGLRDVFSATLFEPPPPTSIDDVIRENHQRVRRRASPRRGAA
jgi:transcriptional regulator with XRE-family HTH domain